MSEMNMDGTTSVQISSMRMNGLRYEAKTQGIKLGYRVQIAPLLDNILKKAGIKEYTNREYNKLVKELGST